MRNLFEWFKVFSNKDFQIASFENGATGKCYLPIDTCILCKVQCYLPRFYLCTSTHLKSLWHSWNLKFMKDFTLNQLAQTNNLVPKHFLRSSEWLMRLDLRYFARSLISSLNVGAVTLTLSFSLPFFGDIKMCYSNGYTLVEWCCGQYPTGQRQVGVPCKSHLNFMHSGTLC